MDAMDLISKLMQAEAHRDDLLAVLRQIERYAHIGVMSLEADPEEYGGLELGEIRSMAQAALANAEERKNER